MKITIIITIAFYLTGACVLGQDFVDKNTGKEEMRDISYIANYPKYNKKLTRLLEWKLSSNSENKISFEHKERLAFFSLRRDSNSTILNGINYYHKSFHKAIFLSDSLRKHEIDSKTQFKVWTSNDKLSTYFCMFSSDSVRIWVFTNGNVMYKSTLAIR